MADEIKIRDFDEEGNELTNVDWSKWYREETIEVTDDNGKLQYITSRCRKYTQEELHEQLLWKLAETESADIKAALCELAEQQAAYEEDVNAALCELYELIAGGVSNG